MYEIFEQLLRAKNITPYRVAKETGIATATLSDWKTGKSTPKADKMQKIADYLGVSLDYLRGNEPNKKSSSQNREEDVEPILKEMKEKAIQGITLMYDGKPINARTMKAFEASLEAAIAILEASKEGD